MRTAARILALASIALCAWLLTRGCASATPYPSTMVRADDGVVVAWAAPEEGRSTIYAFKMLDRDFANQSGPVSILAAGGEPEVVFRANDFSGPPEIARGDKGYLVLAHRHDGELFAIALNKKLKTKGTRKRIAHNVTTVCPSPGARQRGYVAAWIERVENRHVLRLGQLSDRGELVNTQEFRAGDGQCAVVATGDRIGLVYRDAQSSELSVAVVRKGVTEAQRSVGIVNKNYAPLRLIRTDEGFALLIGDQSRRAIVIRLDENAEFIDRFDLRDVDPKTLDLAVNDKAFIASYFDGNELKIRAVDSSGKLLRQYEHEAGDDPNGTRALGAGEGCAATWTEFFGRIVWVLRSRRCP